MAQKRIQLDRTKLLGFKLEASSPKANGASAKIGTKFGTKLGGKSGNKPVIGAVRV